jgi:hypothetical protein
METVSQNKTVEVVSSGNNGAHTRGPKATCRIVDTGFTARTVFMLFGIQ